MSSFATGAAASLAKVTDRLGGLGTVAAIAGVALAAGLVVGVKALFDLGQSFDKAYDRIQITTGASAKVMGELKQAFKDTLEQVPNSMSETADAVGGLNATLGVSGNRLSEVSTSLLTFSRLTGTEVKQNVTDFSRVMGDWSISTADAELTMDKLLRTSQLTQIPMQQLMQTVVSYGAPMRSLGFSFEETIAMLGKWQKEGVNTETVLRGMKQGLAQVAQDGGRFANVLRDDFPEAFKQFEQANTLAERFRIGFGLVVDTFQKVGEVPAADLSTKLFGARAGPDVFAAIREGRFDVADLVGEINNAAGAVANTAAKTDDWAEKWDTLKNKLKVLFEPAAIAVFEKVNDLLDSIFGDRKPSKKPTDIGGAEITGSVKDLNSLLAQQKGVLKDLNLGASVTPTPEMLKRIQETKDSIARINDQLDRTDPKRIKGLKAELKDLNLAQSITPTPELQNKISELQKKIRDSLSQKPGAKSWWQTVTDSFQHDFVDVMSEKATSFRLHFLEPLGGLGIEFADVFGDKGVAGQAHGAANSVRDAITGIFDFDWFTTARENVETFFGNLPGWILTFFTGPETWLWEKGSSIIGGLLSGATSKFLELLGWLGGIGGAVIEWTGDAGVWLWQKGVDLAQGLWNGASGKVGEFLPWVGGIGGAVIAWVGDAGVWLWQKGVDLAQGLWNGASSKIGEFLGWVGGIGGAVLGSLGDLGSVLWDAGAALLGGLIGGAKGAWNGFAEFWNGLRIPGFEITMPSAIPNIKWGGFDFPDLPTFEKGGIVPGARGQGVPIMAHAGELVVPADQAGMVAGVPGTDLVNTAATDALAAQQKYVDESAALLTSATDLQLSTQGDYQTSAIEGLTDTSAVLNETWSTGLSSMVDSTGAYLTLLNAGAQAQYGALSFATGATMVGVVDTMTAGASQAADSFVGQLGARIPPLQSTLASYSESVKGYGRDFLGAIGVPAGFRRGGLFETVDPRVPQIASDGSYGVFAERGTGGEALIPKHGAANPLGVLSTAASWYGYSITPYQAGGLTLEELFWRDQGWDLGKFIGTVSGHYDHVHAGAGLGHTWPELDAYLVGRGITPGPGSTTSGGHAANSLHFQNRAKDYGNANNPVEAIFNAFLPLAMGMAATALERAVVPAPPDFGPGILGNGMSPGMALSMAQIMQIQMQSKLDKARDELMARMTAGGGTGAFGDLQAYAGTKLGGFGWGIDQLGALIELWNRESGWNPNAVNPSSGAWGIAQFLGKGAPTWNPYEQIDRGLAYIADRYGSPAAALAFHTRNNWYKRGGVSSFADGGIYSPEALRFYEAIGANRAFYANAAQIKPEWQAALAFAGQDLARVHHLVNELFIPGTSDGPGGIGSSSLRGWGGRGGSQADFERTEDAFHKWAETFGLRFTPKVFGGPFWNWASGGIAFSRADTGRLNLQPGLNAVYNGLGRVESLAEGGGTTIHTELNFNGPVYGDAEALEALVHRVADERDRELERTLDRKLGRRG